MIFITGGVRSGKSAYAEQRALSFGREKQYYYVATGIAFDQEMKKRIMRHQQDREQQSISWTIIEMQATIPQVIQHLSPKAVVLFECITTWLSNVLYLSEQQNNRNDYIKNCIDSLQRQLLTWQAQGVTIIVVSNEVLDELPSRYDEVNNYRKILGNLHQWLVYHSSEAYEVQFQLVQRWK